jgi:hypothetical protein
MKKTYKKNNQSNNTKKNTKTMVNKCMETFVEKKVKYWNNFMDEQINKLENKKLTKDEEKILTKLKKNKKNKKNIINLKKLYQIDNCNINCKNTLLEPGSPNQIPKSMRKKYNNNKRLIKAFTKKRKEIFKNKRNVLIDNFYENTPELTKKNLIKEGAISECIPLFYNLTGGSIIMKDGDMIKTDETFNGKPFFRKVFYLDESNSNIEKKNRLAQAANAEYKISSILIKNPFPNIVTFYEVNKEYIEMEALDTNITTKLNSEKLKETMKKVKDFLQSLGIMYIDWKTDNIGISKDGTYKLFDFDVSGLIDLTTNKWIIEPLHFWSYNKAIENGCTTPQEIDDYSFDNYIMSIKPTKSFFSQFSFW